jgi:hypothetical protein
MANKKYLALFILITLSCSLFFTIAAAQDSLQVNLSSTGHIEYPQSTPSPSPSITPTPPTTPSPTPSHTPKPTATPTPTPKPTATPTPTPKPTATPTPTPKPTATPTPTPYPSSAQNIAPLDSAHWGTYESYPPPSYPVLYNNHIDSTVLFNGHSTLRIDPHTSSDTNTVRESDSLWFPVKPGDHIVFTCWMKVQTGSSSTFYPQCGARIGVDFYNSHYLTGISWAGQYVYPWQSWTQQAVADNWVCDANGGAWQHRTLDFIMPNFVHNDISDGMEVPSGMIPWMQAGPYDSTQSSVWFADPQIYINP